MFQSEASTNHTYQQQDVEQNYNQQFYQSNNQTGANTIGTFLYTQPQQQSHQPNVLTSFANMRPPAPPTNQHMNPMNNVLNGFSLTTTPSSSSTLDFTRQLQVYHIVCIYIL